MGEESDPGTEMSRRARPRGVWGRRRARAENLDDGAAVTGGEDILVVAGPVNLLRLVEEGLGENHGKRLDHVDVEPEKRKKQRKGRIRYFCDVKIKERMGQRRGAIAESN